MEQSYMKTRPVLPLVLSMSLPMVLSMLVNSLYNIVDSYFVAKISEDAMTALSLVFPLQNLITAVSIGFAIGVNAVISYHLGAGEPDQAGAAASQGLTLSALQSMALTAGCIAVMPAFLRFFTQEEAVVSLGLRYSSIVFLFTIMFALGMTAEKVFQAEGRMLACMLCVVCACGTNIVLDPIMIFGWGPVPAMGIEGAALATGIGQTINLLLYILLYFRGGLNIRIRLQQLKPRRDMVRRLYAIGIPAALNLGLSSLLISALNGILSAYEQSYVLVLGVYYKLQTFLYLPANGIIQGMRPLVGYNFGAGEHGRVRSIYRTGLVLAAGIMAAGTLLCWTIPEGLMGLFSKNPETVQMGGRALRIISLGFVVSSLSAISSGALEGLGKGMPALVISALRHALLIIPAAWLFSRLWGPEGVWQAFWVAELLTAAIAWPVYRRYAQKEPD